MNTKKSITRLSAALTILGMASVALAPCAYATQVPIGFNGGGATGSLVLTIGLDGVVGDPLGAEAITGAHGTFSDSNLGIVNALITGVYALKFSTPVNPADIPYILKSYSYVPSVGGANHGIGASYDNLFYRAGSPVVCNPAEYPFSGGFLDTFGVLLTLDNHEVVNLFSWGVTPSGLSYGLSVLQGSDSAGWAVKDFAGSVRAAVPAPNFLWLFGAGVLGLFTWRRSKEKGTPTTRTA